MAIELAKEAKPSTEDKKKDKSASRWSFTSTAKLPPGSPVKANEKTKESEPTPEWPFQNPTY